MPDAGGGVLDVCERGVLEPRASNCGTEPAAWRNATLSLRRPFTTSGSEAGSRQVLNTGGCPLGLGPSEKPRPRSRSAPAPGKRSLRRHDGDPRQPETVVRPPYGSALRSSHSWGINPLQRALLVVVRLRRSSQLQLTVDDISAPRGPPSLVTVGRRHTLSSQ